MSRHVKHSRAVAALLGVLSCLLASCGVPTGTAPPSPSTSTTAAGPDTSTDALTCAALTKATVYRARNADGAALLTADRKEAEGSAKYGYADVAALFTASPTARPGLHAVSRYYKDGDFAWAASPAQSEQLVGAGYVAQSTEFYAALEPSACTEPVFTFRKGDKHSYAVSDQDGTKLAGSGWVKGEAVFYVGRAPELLPSTDAPALAIPDPDPQDPEFTFAVVPDTQQEVLADTDTRLADRFRWLVDHKASDDIRFVVQLGDLLNWPTPDDGQEKIARAALSVLQQGGLPYFLNVGNHDGQAVCPGGSACDETLTPALMRDTSTFNEYFPADHWGAAVGEFESGKVDNTYSTMAAGGVKWLLLNLEMWPRAEVVAWADRVIASHGDYNVLVFTHSYLDAAGSIYQTSDYGDTSPQELFDSLLKKHANVKMVFCAHTGTFATRTDTGADGDTIYTMLTALHSTSDNPTRMVQVNTKAGTIKTWIYSPSSGKRLPGADHEFTGVKLIS
jgi:hypothetical protein